jgi:CO dehydrogenase/acetyl-CoA synthase epsilon subunit
MSSTGTKRKTTEADGSVSDDKAAVAHPSSAEPVLKKSKSDLNAVGSGGAAKKSKIVELIEKIGSYYEVLPAESPDKIKAAVENAKKSGYNIPNELEDYFLACDGLKSKDEDTEVLFFGLKSIIDTERIDDTNGCLVEQIEEEDTDAWKDSEEIEPLKSLDTKKGVLIGSGVGEEILIYLICDPKSKYYGKIVSKSTGFTGVKLCRETLSETLLALLMHLEEQGHGESITIFFPDFRDDGEVDDDADGDYNEDDEDE